MKRFVYILLMLFLSGLSVTAQDLKVEADSAYSKQDYQKAITGYESLITSNGESFEVRYNLGNAYFKLNQLGKAILNYEKALLLQPNNEDAKFNLEFVKSKTTDKIVPRSRIFIVTWIDDFCNLMSEYQWSVLGIILFVTMLIGLVLYFFAPDMRFRKMGFYGALICLLATVVVNLCAFRQSRQLSVHNRAVVTVKVSMVKSTPNQRGTNLFQIHEGTDVTITENSLKDWKEIILADGKKGWISTTDIEII